MKYSISDMRQSDTQEVDVTRFFPKAEGKVVIRVRRLTNEKRNEVLSLSILGQVRHSDGAVEIREVGSITKSDLIYLLHGIDTKADDFPFENWNEQIIKEIDQRNPEFLSVVSDAVEGFNFPLARKSGEKSETLPDAK